MNISSLADKLRAGARAYIIGNGGSHANAIHVANDLLAAGVRAHTIDPATLTALANDYGWYQAYVRWLNVVGERRDVLIAFSGSGKSPNILLACETAKEIGMDVFQEFGAEQGFDMQSAEERQVWLGHELRRLLDRR